MTYRLLADSGCTDGTCPTFYVDDETGDVIVRGYNTNTRRRTWRRWWRAESPNREMDVRIPAAKWARLVSQLPR